MAKKKEKCNVKFCVTLILIQCALQKKKKMRILYHTFLETNPASLESPRSKLLVLQKIKLAPVMTGCIVPQSPD